MEGIEGVITAMELARRKAAAAQKARTGTLGAQSPVPSGLAPPGAPAAAQARPAVQARAVQTAAPQPAPAPPRQAAQAGPLQTMFEDGNSLLKAIVASEILGPPAALRERHLWNQPPNEPSISAR